MERAEKYVKCENALEATRMNSNDDSVMDASNNHTKLLRYENRDI